LDGVTKTYEEIANVAANIATAANVIVIGGTTDITAAAVAVAADATVVATVGLIVFSDGVDTFVYYSTYLAANGTETLVATLAGITTPTSLVTGDFVFA
jgi:arginase family enzyme